MDGLVIIGLVLFGLIVLSEGLPTALYILGGMLYGVVVLAFWLCVFAAVVFGFGVLLL